MVQSIKSKIQYAVEFDHSTRPRAIPDNIVLMTPGYGDWSEGLNANDLSISVSSGGQYQKWDRGVK